MPGYPVMVGYPMFPPSLPMVVPGTGQYVPSIVALSMNMLLSYYMLIYDIS